ncbi:hypothetical protein FPSE_01625 [Fusarium pseudograminearum CS3096]|uniref:Uncharacterized protein n=1 Tax=Fusarium pseudograminearum (strain CS3096) TaxID=1028729 RepID=K3VSA0_FUSPC|nr:hypothetical protein FPSE_01625 [Fusarium pseudograminearum CS3096]EKJ78164.1 hypothetical protein FPSE_01625 [Fusarium pseudograminearum CS3096]
MASNGTQGSDAIQNPAPQSDKPVPQNVANVSGGNSGRGRGQGVFGAPRGPFSGGQITPHASRLGVQDFGAGRYTANQPNYNADTSRRAEARRQAWARTITFTAEDLNEPEPKQAIVEDVNDNNQLRAENELLSGQLERIRIERDAAVNKLRENECIWLDSLKQVQDQLSKAHDKIHSLEREKARLESYQRGYQTDIQVTRTVADKIERELSETTNRLYAALGEISSLEMKIASLKRSQGRN